MNKIRKGDKVILNTGKDKGKQGIVLNILKNNRVVVEGLNVVKKHTKPNPAKGDQGGLVSKEMPINISNIAIFNTKLNKTDKESYNMWRNLTMTIACLLDIPIVQLCVLNDFKLMFGFTSILINSVAMIILPLLSCKLVWMSFLMTLVLFANI